MALTFLGKSFEIAQLADVPWPTSTGGNTKDCPLHTFTTVHQQKLNAEPSGSLVVDHLDQNPVAVNHCWHHRRPGKDRHYVAELSCWFVKHNLQPFEEAIQAVVVRDGRDPDLWEDVYSLFVDPVKWAFQPGAPASNGRHRICSLKAVGVTQLAVRRI